MTHTIECKVLDGSKDYYEIDEYPSECPICHIKIRPLFMNSNIIIHNDSRIEAIFHCTNPDCGRLFIAIYHFDISYPSFYLKKTEPVYQRDEIFPDQIKQVSPTFVEIYNQAMAAEAFNLDQLTGIGLRKALEHLVKDFAISQKKDKEDVIKSTFLGKCIKNYLDDPKIQVCAKLAT